MRFLELCETFERISKNRSRIYITNELAALYTRLNPEEARALSYLLIGEISPPFRAIELGVSSNLILQALSTVLARSKDSLEQSLKRWGDIGDFIHVHMRERKINPLMNSSELSILDVYNYLHKIARENTQRGKVDIIINLLLRMNELEGKYLGRMIVNKTRISVGVATVLDSIAQARGVDREIVRTIYYLVSDIGLTAERVFLGDLSYKIQIFNPISPALAERVGNSEQIIEKIGKGFAEYKYDGFRAQVHKRGREIRIFSRRLEDITGFLPEIVEDFQRISNDVIVEGEIVSIVDGKPVPFQELIKRKRKYDVLKYSNMIPVRMYAFDILYLDGVELYSEPFKNRREVLSEFLREKDLERIYLSEGMVVENKSQLDIFFNKALDAGMEGVIVKRLDSPYTPGQRNHNWIKLKRISDTIDGLVVGYFYGQGRLRDYPGSLLVCVYDEELDEYQTVAKVSSGLSEEEFMKLKDRFVEISSPYINLNTRIQPDVWIEPNTVVELNYDNITLSPTHTCASSEFGGRGLALRFPRIVQIREDKSMREVTTVSEMISLYRSQGENQSTGTEGME
ncbi:MAG: ATP-dependent DNA ligase [Candidatus Micrarchaeota archaeon]|nr:ATP-dependent DNA ligase [Candidatus Micrarchaeota archaeon]